MSKLNYVNMQTLEVNKEEALLLLLLLEKALETVETNYQKNKEDESFLKEEALLEIALVRGLLTKVHKLEVL